MLEIFKHYTYGLILRFEIALLFSRKSESFYLIYALCLFLVINATVTFPLGLAELVNRSLLSELGVDCLSGLWEDLSLSVPLLGPWIGARPKNSVGYCLALAIYN